MGVLETRFPRRAAALAAALLLACGGGSGPGGSSGGGGGGCTPGGCVALAACGTVPDGCGSTQTCGGCSLPETCGGAMTAHLCGACSGGWCAEDPLGPGQSGFQFITGTSATDVWATGLQGLVFEWDGTAWHDRSSTWTPNGSPPAAGPTRVWGTGPSSMWGVSRLGIWRWNGSAWSLARPGWVLNAISGTSDADVWAVGDAGLAVHFDGSAWSTVPNWTGTTNALADVWAHAAGDVWAVGVGSTLLHWNGSAWSSPLTSTGSVSFLKVHGTAPTDVWVVGDDGWLHRWIGTDWAIGGAGQLYAHDVRAVAANDAWAVGSSGLVEHWDGSTWTTQPSGTTASIVSLWTAPNGDTWFVSNLDGKVYRRLGP